MNKRKKNNLILGVTGLSGSGKDTVAAYIEKKGFKNYSLSDEIRIEARKRGLGTDRDSLIKLVDEMRRKLGKDILSQRMLKRIKGDSVVTSFRHPVEIENFKKLPNFYLIDVKAPIKIRFQRAIARNRAGEAKWTFAKFIDREKKERRGTTSQQLDDVIKEADYTIDNSRDLKHLYHEADRVMAKIYEESNRK